MNQKTKNLIKNLPEDFDPKLEEETNDLEKIDQAKLDFDREQTQIIAEHGIAGIVEVEGVGRFEVLRRWFAKGFYEMKF